MKNIRKSLHLFLALLLGACSHGDPESTTSSGAPFVKIHEVIAQKDVKRFGMNLNRFESWSTGQILKNLVRRNPGFEGSVFRSIVKVKDSKEKIFTDHGGSAWENGFWNGASYEVLSGRAKGKVGIIEHFKPGEESGHYEARHPLPKLRAGDFVVLRQDQETDPTLGWWVPSGKVMHFTPSIGEIRPGSPGRQSLRLDVSRTEGSATIHCHFDNVNVIGKAPPILNLSQGYTLSFWARAMKKGSSLGVMLKRHTQPNQVFINQTIQLEESWQKYDFKIGPIKDDQAAALELWFEIQTGACLLDDVSLSRDDDLNPTAFRSEVISILKQLNPGILRYWIGQLGDSLENQLAKEFSQKLSGYARWDSSAGVLGYSLADFLLLCQHLGADPWYVVPLSFTRQERADLIEYLAGDADTPMGRLRAADGHPQPWSEVFNQIYLEMGNENWNTLFEGGNIPNDKLYSRLCRKFFTEFREHPNYKADRFQLMIGGQAIKTERNQEIASGSQGHDRLCLAPYLLYKLNKPTDPLTPLAQMFAEVALLGKAGYMFENAAMLKKSGHGSGMSIYEVNLHTVVGSASEALLEQLLASAAAGTAVATHMLNMLANLGIREQCFYTLNQRSYLRKDRKEIPLFGAVHDLEPEGLRRPQFLALTLCNKALSGDLLKTEVGGENQSFELGNIPIDQPLHAYAFRDGNRYSLIVANLNPRDTLYFQLKLDQPVTGPVEKSWLSFAKPLDNNEQEQKVKLAQETMAGFPVNMRLEAPAAGLVLWQWQAPST